ncbi:central kinetochore-associated domain-containing protein [Sarocladium implicatum]|nr:central kinetochore-associated domain-containing protein [Sarocladium implicatum]
MTAPLAPAHEASLNHTPLQAQPSPARYEDYEVQTYTTTEMTMERRDHADDSSPFVSCINEAQTGVGQENVSPSKARHSRVLSGAELSPLKLSVERDGSVRNPSPERTSSAASLRSPRKMSPVKRFPVKVSGSQETFEAMAKQQPQPEVEVSKPMDLDDAIRQNAGLKRAIEIFEDEQSAMEMDGGDAAGAGKAMKMEVEVDVEPEDEAAGPDDTMMSTFSTFSAVPSMFSKYGQSPAKLSAAGGLTPRARPDPSPSRTPRGNPSRHESANNTINLLMDFTEQLRHPQQKSPSKRGNLSPSRTTPNRSSPGKTYNNLIDFDLPPMPTPRSVPSITPRELESLKSAFLSEISSLKASLSGKEAEVHSLKTAVGDAEKRVGESMEQLREERAQKEQLSAEKEDWEARGREVEGVLRKVKEEIVLGQREREELERKLDESEKRREAAEMLHQEAESKMAGMRAGKDAESSKNGSQEKAQGSGDAAPSSTRDVEIAVERVARELHGLYKSKHETKVAALKKSYEARWEKKITQLEQRIEELNDDNEKLRIGRDNTLTKVVPGSEEAEQRMAQAAKDGAAIKELEADVQRLEAVVGTVQRDNEELRVMLERERVEKGELVQLAEEMMNMQSFVGGSSAASALHSSSGAAAAVQTPATTRRRTFQPENQPPASSAPQQQQPQTEFKTPRARTSGIKAPGTGMRPKSGGLPRPGGASGAPRSGIMSSIEQMGSYGRRRGE